MKRKINKMLVMIATLAIFMTILLITVVYYDIFRRQMMDDLHSHALLLREYVSVEDIQKIGADMDSEVLRVTLIGADGSVVFDNQADTDQMENHSERPEIVEALTTGEGQAVRNSQTLSRDTFYYAVRLQDGQVLRVAKDAGSIFSIFGKSLPSLIVIFVILVVLCLVMAHFLTGKLIIPIEQLAENLDEYNGTADYEELTPFINMIKQQHLDIIKNAKIRQEFTANVSHELKTPLTSISGYAELIETEMASEADVVRFAHGIHNSANRLLTLINDIIRLSELDGTEEEVVLERLNLFELARTCVDMLTMNAEKHNVSISIQGAECYIEGSRQMMEELLFNLCDNAIRYNNVNGRVDVEVYARDGHTYLVVKDTGIGIPKEHQERIFERFYRVDKSRSKSTGGTGLGLAIVKHIIVKHNAQLELESEAGKGTIIKVVF